MYFTDALSTLAAGESAEFLPLMFFLFCRFSLVPGLHPDWMLMLFFAHTHLTVSVTLALLLIPKVNTSLLLLTDLASYEFHGLCVNDQQNIQQIN